MIPIATMYHSWTLILVGGLILFCITCLVAWIAEFIWSIEPEEEAEPIPRSTPARPTNLRYNRMGWICQAQNLAIKAKWSDRIIGELDWNDIWLIYGAAGINEETAIMELEKNLNIRK